MKHSNVSEEETHAAFKLAATLFANEDIFQRPFIDATMQKTIIYPCYFLDEPVNQAFFDALMHVSQQFGESFYYYYFPAGSYATDVYRKVFKRMYDDPATVSSQLVAGIAFSPQATWCLITTYYDMALLAATTPYMQALRIQYPQLDTDVYAFLDEHLELLSLSQPQEPIRYESFWKLLRAVFSIEQTKEILAHFSMPFNEHWN